MFYFQLIFLINDILIKYSKYDLLFIYVASKYEINSV